jgi:L-arabonate dehydrase
MPSGKFLMEDFYYAGGLPAVIRRRSATSCIATRRRSPAARSGENNEDRRVLQPRGHPHPFDKPFKPEGGIAVLRGNLAPDGAVIKPSAATPR